MCFQLVIGRLLEAIGNLYFFSFFKFWWCASLATNLFSLQKYIYIGSKIRTFIRMTLIDNSTILINEQNVRNSFNLIDDIIVRLAFMIMNRTIPILLLDMILQRVQVRVLTDTDYFNLVSPFFTMFFQHIFVVFHWLLAWRTPCGPKVN